MTGDAVAQTNDREASPAFSDPCSMIGLIENRDMTQAKVTIVAPNP